MSKNSKHCVFNEIWLKDPRFSDWLEKSDSKTNVVQLLTLVVWVYLHSTFMHKEINTSRLFQVEIQKACYFFSNHVLQQSSQSQSLVSKAL